MFNQVLYPSEFFPDAFWPKILGAEDEAIVVSDGPVQLTFRYSTGELLSADPSKAATTFVDAPGYVSVPHVFVGGTLTVRPIGVGTGTVTVSYVDPVLGPMSVSRIVKVVKE